MAEEHDGKVVFDLDVDDSQIKQKLNKTISDMERSLKNGKSVKVTVDADTAAASTNLHKVKSAADALESSDPTVTVNADTSGANANLNKTKAAAEAVEGTDPTVTVDADTSAADEALEDLSDSIDEVAKKSSAIKLGIAQGVGQSLGNAGMKLAGGVLGGIGDVFSGGASYETALAKASTLMPDSADLNKFSEGLLALSTETGEDVGILAEAAYNMLSAGVGYGNAGGDQLLAFLRSSAQLGAGGFSDTNSAGLAVKKTLNAYGMSDTEQQRVANMMIKTQNKGITDVDKLSASMSNITSTAAAAGVSIEEVGAILATITAQGTETAEATTQARALISELMDPSTDAAKNMAKALHGTQYAGMGINEIMGAGGNMVDILGAMQAYSGKNGIKFIEMFGSLEAYNAALKLVNENGEMYLENLEYMIDDTDVVRDAYETMAATNATTLKKINAQMQAIKLQLYMALAPAIEKLLGVMDSDKFKGAVDDFVDMIVEFLSGDGAYKVIEGLISAAEWLLAVLNGDISLGDELNKWVRAIGMWLIAQLKGAAEWAVNGLIDVVNGLIEGLNGFLKLFGLKIEPIEKVDWTPEPERRGGGGGGTGGGAGRYANDRDEAGKLMQLSAKNKKAAEEFGESLRSADRWTKSTGTGMSRLVAAIKSKTSELWGIEVPRVIGSSGGMTSTAQKFAVGLDRVPYDNYPALLHRGEMVLTAAEASAYRMTGSSNHGAGIDYGALAAAMANLTVEMDKKTVGRMVEKSVSAAQSDRLHRYSGRK